MKLLIVIPALNEANSIESIITRSLSARASIIKKTPVTEVDITVVSDGSTDRTAEIAGKYKDNINIIVFKKNKGYGAAIKAGWEQSDADFLSFLDADGTCDPNFFITLANLIQSENADVVLGCRMNKQSKMPLLRRTGNTIFSLLLTFFSSTHIRDTASGMRIVRSSSLPKLMPLPDGLHFTPAMSARAILSSDIKIIETDMPYHEREGESKLNAFYDGIRFLKVILSTVFLYKPSRPLSLMGGVCFLIAFLLMITPILHYLQYREVQEWMVYRFVVSNLLGNLSILLFSFSYLSNKIVMITLSKNVEMGLTYTLISRILANPLFWTVPCTLLLTGGLLVLPSFIELVITGATYEHWSRFIVMSFFFSIAFILIITWLINYTLSLVSDRVNYLKSIR
ncbi:MAG: glycosyltransferase family 2 protein [Fibrobacteria bacterium]|nr:glycosyltransferase family 2 protein [Fibrobacteria bacterium]